MGNGLKEKERSVRREAGFSDTLISELDAYAGRVVWIKIRRFLARQSWSLRTFLISFVLVSVLPFVLGFDPRIAQVVVLAPLLGYGIWRIVLEVFGRRQVWKRAILGHVIPASFGDDLNTSASGQSLQHYARIAGDHTDVEKQVDALKGQLAQNGRNFRTIVLVSFCVLAPIGLFVMITVLRQA